MTRIAAVATLIVAACGGGTPRAGSPGAVAGDDSDAPSRVLNLEAHGWSGEASWTVEENLRLGAADGVGPEAFFRIRALAVDGNGSVHVLDGGSEEVRVFDAEGRFLRSVGGAGEGPGEFGEAAGFAFAPDGSLWVVDYGLDRYTVFTPRGYARSVRRPVQGLLYPWSGWFDDGGRLIDISYERPEPDSEEMHVSALVRVSSDGAVVDTAAVLAHRVPVTHRRQIAPFGHRLRWARDRPGSAWVFNTAEYAIARMSLRGDTSLVFTLDSEPAPVGAAERDSLLGLRQFGRARYLPDEIPSAKPILMRVLSGDDGYVYVIPRLRGRVPGSVLDVFADGGAYVGRLDIEPPILAVPGAPTPLVRQGHLYGVARDHLGVEHVVRYRFGKPAA